MHYRGYLRFHGAMHGRLGRLGGTAIGKGFSTRWDSRGLLLSPCSLWRALCIPAVPFISLQSHEQQYNVKHVQ